MMGFGFFSIWILLGRLALLLWFVYWLFARSGWLLTRQPVERNSANGENE
jgi:hypothetical protein